MSRHHMLTKLQELRESTNSVIETLIYMIGDCEQKPTEDELLNVLNGFSTLNKFQHKKITQEIKLTVETNDDGN